MKHIIHRRILCICVLLLAMLINSVSVYAQATPAMELSQEEKDYIEEKKVLKVAVPEGWYPIASPGKADGPYHGLALDILYFLERETGLQIEVLKAEDYPNAFGMVENGKADVAAVVTNYENMPTTERLDVTDKYLQVSLVMMHHKRVNVDLLSGMTLAHVKETPFLSERETLSYMDFASPEQCLLAVRVGQADAMFCNIFTGTDYVQKFENREMTTIPVDVKEEYRFGIRKGGDERLKGLLNHTISSVSREDKNASLIHGFESRTTSPGDVVYRYPFEIICGILSIAFLICLSVFLYSRVKSTRQVSMHGYETSYRILADTLGGIGMNYDCIQDTMTIFGEGTEMLSMPTEIKNFSAYLKNAEKDIFLTPEQLDWMISEGVAENEHSMKTKCKMKDGKWSHFNLIFSVLYTEKAYYRPISLIGCLMDIEADYSEKEQLLKMSHYDNLTGLYNRIGAKEVIQQQRQKGEDHKNDILLMIDLDDFKKCNDTYGHTCGDDILIYVGKRLQSIFRKDDVLCRWGGDEFYLYLFGAAKNLDRIKSRCQNLQEEMRKYRYEGKELPISISIGGAVVGDHSREETFELADRALYMVKKEGKNAICIVED